MRALIDWIPVEQGGRRTQPTGIGDPPYSPHVRFLDEPWPPEIEWSFAVRKECELGGSHRWLADVNFRYDDAPSESLREGRDFELYEGKTCVARGQLIGNDVSAKVADAQVPGRNSG